MKKQHNLSKALIWFVISILSLVAYIYVDIGKLNILFFALSTYAFLCTASNLLKEYVEINSNQSDE